MSESSNKGKLWRLFQSWWILLTFTIFFNWIAFFYIASRAKHMRWALWGLVYSVPFVLAMIEKFETASWQYELIAAYMFTSGIFSIFHGFKIRKEYLLRLEARQLKSKLLNEEAGLRRMIEKEYGVNLSPESPRVSAQTEKQNQPVQTVLPIPDPTPVLQPEVAPATPPAAPAGSSDQKRMDINRASEEELAGLPSVGIILAKKVIQYRQANTGFQSVDEFLKLLGLRPNQMEKIRPLLEVVPLEPNSPQSGARVVDF